MQSSITHADRITALPSPTRLPIIPPHVSIQSCIAKDSNRFVSLQLINSEWSLQKMAIIYDKRSREETLDELFEDI